MNIDELYQRRHTTPWVLNELMPVLRKYGEECETIYEFGVEMGYSTVAFLAARPKELHSYDIAVWPEFQEVEEAAKTIDGTRFYLHLESSLDADFEATNLLFLDSLHTYSQVRDELRLHGHKSRKYLIFHDTIEWAYRDQPSSVPQLGEDPHHFRFGKHQQVIGPAIGEYMVEHPEWKIWDHYYHQSGMTVYKWVE